MSNMGFRHLQELAARSAFQFILVTVLFVSWSSADTVLGTNVDGPQGFDSPRDGEHDTSYPNRLRFQTVDIIDYDRESLFTGSLAEMALEMGKPKCRSKKDCKHAACKQKRICRKKKEDKDENENICKTRKCKITARRMLKNSDPNVEPCDNFYKYACGGFIKNHPVHGNLVVVSQDAAINDDLKRQYKAILEAPSDASTHQFLIEARRNFTTCRSSSTASTCLFEAINNNDTMWALAGSYARNNKISQDDEKRIREMLKNIVASFNEEVDRKTWINQNIKIAAKRKAMSIKNKMFLGESDGFLDQTTRPQGDLLRDELPTGINAFYLVSENSITVNRAIIDEPYYGMGLDVLDYAALGETIAHELTHAFDRDGIDHDENGNRVDWFDSSEKRFYERAKCLREQYDDHFIIDRYGEKMHLNGLSSLDEDIADNGGIRWAFSAYKRITKSKKVQRLIRFEHLTDEQLFFLGYANIYCQSENVLFTEATVENEIYSPVEFRTNIPLSNFEEFAKAWKCPRGSPMNPKHKCRLW